MNRQPIILLADDDEDDRMLTGDALRRAQLGHGLQFVEDGEQLLEYLRRQGRWADPAAAPWPDLILLDLNMPRKDGREALREIRADPALQLIPVVVLTTSHAEADVIGSYRAGASSFVTKPPSFEGLQDVVAALKAWWFKAVVLPTGA